MSIRFKGKLDNTPPTKKQWETIAYISSCIAKNGYSPSIKELAKHFKISISSAWERIEKIRRKQYIQHWRNAKRGIDIPDHWDKREEIGLFLNYNPPKETGLKNYLNNT